MERYRSGHNEAVLKTVCPQGRVGSNPTLSVRKSKDLRFREKSRKKLKKVLTTSERSDKISELSPRATGNKEH